MTSVGLAGLEAAGEQELQDYVETLGPGTVKERMHGLALYYAFAANEPLTRLTGEIRERRIAKTRRALKPHEFRGVDLEDVARLKAIGIVTAGQVYLLDRSRLKSDHSPRDRCL